MAQKNNLKYIILGLLSEQSLTGYDITKAFDSDIGEFWSANHSQIYPLLIKMEANGLISHEIIVTGAKLEKKLYSLTQTGTIEFKTWLQSPTPELSASKDEFILKLYFIENSTDPLLPEMLAEQLMLHHNKLVHLQSQMTNKFENTDRKQAQFGHFLILQHAIERETAYESWLQQTINNLGD